MDITIRKGTEKDAKGVIEVNTFTWLTTYKGLISNQILEKRIETMDKRVVRIIDEIKKYNNLYVALDNKKVVGMMMYGKSRNTNYPDSGEIYAIYILDNYQGLGIGKKLFMLGIKELINLGFNSMILNVLDGNKAISFYQKYGGIKKEIIQEQYCNTNLTEHIIYFDNLNKIYSEFFNNEETKKL